MVFKVVNKAYIIILLSLLFSDHGFGQGQKYAFLEAGGPSIFTSANFDMRFRPGSREGWGARAGVGHSFLFTDGEGIDAFTFPVGINYLHGKNRGGLLLGLNVAIPYLHGRVIREAAFAGVTIGAKPVIAPEIGYRYRPLISGIGFHFSYTPLFNTVDGFMPVFLGIGIGYSWR